MPKRSRNTPPKGSLLRMTEGTKLKCPECSHVFAHLPVQPLYTLQMAAMFIPMTLSTLRSRLKSMPARYAHEGRTRRRIRMLTGTEVRRLRSQAITGPGGSAL
jgi:hypothetical protein